MKLGISSYAFGWAVATPSPPAARPFTPDTLLDYAVSHDVPVIQFGDNLPLHALDEQQLDAFASRARSKGVAIETGARGLTAEHLERYIELSRRVGARLLRFVIDAKDYEPHADAVVRLVRHAVPALEAAGVTLGIENHDRFPSATLRRMIEAIGSDQVGVCLDTANSLGAGEGINEVVGQLATVCVNVHVKDFAIERLPYLMGFTVTGRPLGGGMLPLVSVLTAVKRHGRCATAVVELWTPPEAKMSDTLEKEARWAEASVTTLRAALAALAA